MQRAEQHPHFLPVAKNINLIWLGSALRASHLEHIKQWKSLNPNYTVICYVDKEYLNDICQQVGNEIEVRLITSIKISANVRAFVNRLVAARSDNLPPNYAAASDIYRCYFNGWYADTDQDPEDVSLRKIDPELNFSVGIVNEDIEITTISPAFFAFNQTNELAASLRDIIEEMSSKISEEHIRAIRSQTASIRLNATYIITGFILRAALGKLLYGKLPVVETLNELHGVTRNLDVINRIKLSCNLTTEKNWIFTDIDTSKALPGINIDKDFNEMMDPLTSKQCMLKTRPKFQFLIDYRKEVFDAVAPRKLPQVPTMLDKMLFNFFSPADANIPDDFTQCRIS